MPRAMIYSLVFFPSPCVAKKLICVCARIVHSSYVAQARVEVRFPLDRAPTREYMGITNPPPRDSTSCRNTSSRMGKYRPPHDRHELFFKHGYFRAYILVKPIRIVLGDVRPQWRRFQEEVWFLNSSALGCFSIRGLAPIHRRPRSSANMLTCLSMKFQCKPAQG